MKASWLSFPALETVGGSVEIAENAKLSALWMPSLTAVDGSFAITRNPQLGASQPAGDAEHVISVDLPALQRIGGDFTLEFNTQLKSLTLYKLREVGRGLGIVSNTAMWQIVMTSLGSVGLACRNHDDFCGDLSIQNNGRLVGVFLPALATLQYDFRVSGNSALVTLQERIQSVSGFYAQDNKSLCERKTLDPILSRMWKLGRFPDKVSIQRNSTQEGCATRCPNESAGVCQIFEDKTSHRSSTEARQPGDGVL
ncbi:hypothetical protein [Pseudomonas syringae]|uniref:Uncharacterized protein n=1 Tax=Pseudomonas syringae TaxID=317 RepID=A0A9Q4A6N2_PSESX|nr:hypothetical protein [Pseudomonas syringae]MCF5469027.1 hypothetical protein [Pseudomonas syringae]MCF5471614.1 hypothetical protein [Pseudomonas syringae]MCF5482591.1 hypothetical protein [Pseudomonas syringae]MCF5489484.1 hypothetical protein [Pseudomonas syringae]MCF5491562.1 hypothetical protein [Pseudomonas syringae]